MRSSSRMRSRWRSSPSTARSSKTRSPRCERPGAGAMPAKCERCLGELGRAAATSQNLMGPLLEAAHARASVGEIMNALADVFGRYEPKSA